MNVGSKVWFWDFDNEGDEIKIAATVTGTFYEPGDSMMAVNIQFEDGSLHGGLEAQDCSPRN